MTRKRLTRNTAKPQNPAAVTDLLRQWGLLNRHLRELNSATLDTALDRTQQLIQQTKRLTQRHHRQREQQHKLRFACEQQRQQMLVVVRRTRNLLFHAWQKFMFSSFASRRLKLLMTRLLLLQLLICRRRHQHRMALWNFFYSRTREREEKPIPITLPNLFDRHTPIGMMTMYPQLAKELLQLSKYAAVAHKPALSTRLYTIAKLLLRLANGAMAAYVFNVPATALHARLQQETQTVFDELTRDYPALTKIIRPEKILSWSKLWQLPATATSIFTPPTIVTQPRPQPNATHATPGEEEVLTAAPMLPTGQSNLRR